MTDRRKQMLEMLGRVCTEVTDREVEGIGVALVLADGSVAFEMQTNDGVAIVAATAMLARATADGLHKDNGIPRFKSRGRRRFDFDDDGAESPEGT